MEVLAVAVVMRGDDDNNYAHDDDVENDEHY